MRSFQSLVEAEFLALDKLILDEMSSEVGMIEEVAEYLIGSGGKRLRPLCLFLVNRLLKTVSESNTTSTKHGISDLSVWYGAVIEFIHTATLLHDDVVDRSSLRRGRPTANEHWGNAPSVLVGDFLYSRAFQMMVRAASEQKSLAIIQLMSDATNVISEGEVLQLVNAKTLSLSYDDYYQVAYKKTAVLFEAACQTASLLHGYSIDSECYAAAGGFGRELGIAFQIMDDVLDYSGESAKLGKNVGDDIAEGKLTLPLVYALNQLNSKGQNSQTNDILATLEQYRDNSAADQNATQIPHIISVVEENGGLRYATEQAGQAITRANEFLTQLPGKDKAALQSLADFAIARRT